MHRILPVYLLLPFSGVNRMLTFYVIRRFLPIELCNNLAAAVVQFFSVNLIF